MRKIVAAMSIAGVALGTSTACATKKFVRQSVGDVNEKADALGRGIEQTQERTRRNEKRISEVDQKVDGVAQVAQAAKGVAATAANTANGAAAKIDAIDRQNRRLILDLVLSESEGNFRFGDAALPPAAKARIDSLIADLKQEPKNVFFEIEGHTDSVGDVDANQRVGLARAESVRRYLYEQYEIPLHKMNVVSYGASKPVASNSTKEGRAQNRRVIIRIVS